MVVSEEPQIWPTHDPCPCGSLFFRNWHLLSSTELTGLPMIHTEARAFDFVRHREESRPSLSLLYNYMAWFETPESYASCRRSAATRASGSRTGKATMLFRRSRGDRASQSTRVHQLIRFSCRISR